MACFTRQFISLVTKPSSRSANYPYSEIISSSILVSYIMKKNPCIVMVPSPGLSHLIPLVEFAKRLLHHHQELHIEFLIPTIGSPSPSIIAILNTLPQNISFTVLPQVNLEDLTEKSEYATLMQRTVKHSLPFLHEALTSLSSSAHLVALVFSLFSVDVLDVAKQFNLLSYVFFASAATALSFTLYFPHLEGSASSDFSHLTKTVNVPGCVVPFQVKDLPEIVLSDKSSEVYRSFIGICQRLSLVDGAVVNTFTDLEADAIREIEHREANRNSPFVYPVGPIIQAESSNHVNRLECVRWLDNQPPNSVLYIAFGSGGTLSHDQLNELAFGLELSGHKFLWAVRVPNKKANAAYLVGQKEDPLQYLPSGFVDRTKGQGLVVPSWAPQIEVLGHESTGGFLTHCGWNSTLESVVHGVPLIAWPLFAEQKMNAVLLTDVLKVALRPQADENGIVTREEIAKVIKRIMEGNEGLEIRKKIKGFSDAATVALSENGSSKKAFSSLAEKWQSI